MTGNNQRVECDFLDPDTATDLLAGTLPTDRRDAVVDHLRRCGDCETRFRELAAHRERRRGAIPPLPLRRSPAPPRRWFGVVAAAAVLALLMLWPHDDPDPGLAPLALPAHAETMLVRARDDDAMRTRLADGLRAYAHGDYDRAADLLDDLTAEGTEAAVRDVYLGSALALTGRDARALSVLDDETIDAIPDPWGNESRWTLCGVLHRLGHRARADSMLQVLADEPGPVGDRARRYLEAGIDAAR